MALTTLADVRLVPGMGNPPYSDAYLNAVIAGVDKAIKSFLKQNVEQAQYTEYRSGNNQIDLPMYQTPVTPAQTTVTAASNGASLPQATINVASTSGFLSTGGKFALQTTVGGTYKTITYTGLTATTFTGCSGGTGTLATGYRAFTPICYYDPLGAWGNNPDGFADGSILALGLAFTPVMGEGGTTSTSGLMRRLGIGGLAGGNPMGWGAYQGWYGAQSKLAASRHVCWPWGDGNLKFIYLGGYATVPADISMAAQELTVWMAQTLPGGGVPLQSEGYEGYSYSRAMQVLSGNTVPELGSVRGLLVPYRDLALGMGV